METLVFCIRSDHCNSGMHSYDFNSHDCQSLGSDSMELFGVSLVFTVGFLVAAYDE